MDKRQQILVGKICPYCDKETELIDSAEIYHGVSYGWMYICRPCDAYVGCYKGTTKSLGRLANAELRKYKHEAHGVFDLIWKSHFDDIVGVSLYKDRSIEHILCWASDYSKGYIDTKPIHASQTQIKGDAEQQLRSQYSHLQGGMFFTLDCISNKELIRELTSYGKDLLVLHSDGSITDDIYKRVCEMKEQYESLNN